MKSPRENEYRKRTKERVEPQNYELEAHLVERNRNPLKLDHVKKWHGIMGVLVIDSKGKLQRTASPIDY